MISWMELSDQYFQWWQDAAGRYLDWFKEQPVVLKAWGGFLDQSLQMKQITDQVIDEFWRAVRLTSREDVIRLHERLNLLESHLVGLQERDWAGGLVKRMEGKVAAPDDLEPLRKMLNGMEKQMAEASAVRGVREGIANLESKLAELSRDVDEIKRIVYRSSSNVDAQPATRSEVTGTGANGPSDTIG
jgi:hypothetical protein